MKIEKLYISNGIFNPIEVIFDKNTLITSDANARGKTTLLRFLLHSLGYKIPSTKKVNMMERFTEVYVRNSKKY